MWFTYEAWVRTVSGALNTTMEQKGNTNCRTQSFLHNETTCPTIRRESETQKRRMPTKAGANADSADAPFTTPNL